VNVSSQSDATAPLKASPGQRSLNARLELPESFTGRSGDREPCEREFGVRSAAAPQLKREQAAARRQNDGFGAGGGAELVEDGVDVEFGGVTTDAEPRGHVAIRQAL